MAQKINFDHPMVYNTNGSESRHTGTFNVSVTDSLNINTIPTGITTVAYGSNVGASTGGLVASNLAQVSCTKINGNICVDVSYFPFSYTINSATTPQVSLAAIVPLGFRPNPRVLPFYASLSIIKSDTSAAPGTNLVFNPAYATLDSNGNILINNLTLTTGLASNFTNGEFYGFTDFRFLFPIS